MIAPITSTVHQFGIYLADQGKELTQQRGWVLSHVLSVYGQFTVEEMVRRFANPDEYLYVSELLVEQTLEELVESGILRRDFVEGETVFYRMPEPV